MKRNKTISTVFYIAALLCYVVALDFIVNKGPTCISLGVVMLACGNIWLKKYKKDVAHSKTEDDKQGEK